MVDATASNSPLRISVFALAALALVASIVAVAAGPSTGVGAQSASVTDVSCFALGTAADGISTSLLRIDDPLDDSARTIETTAVTATADQGTSEQDTADQGTSEQASSDAAGIDADVVEPATVPLNAQALAVRADPSVPEAFGVWGWSNAAGLVTIDLTTGASSSAPFAAPGSDGANVVGMTFEDDHDPDPANDMLWIAYSLGAEDDAPQPPNQLVAYRMDGTVATGPITVTFGAFDTLNSIAWDSATGVLYGVIASSGESAETARLISIDSATGAATGIGATADGIQGVAFAPTGELVAVRAVPADLATEDAAAAVDAEAAAVAVGLNRIDKSTGATTALAELDQTSLSVTALDCVDPRPLPANPGIVSAAVIDECVAGSGRITASLTWAGGEASVDWVVSLTGRPDLTGTLSTNNVDDRASFDQVADGALTATVTNAETGAVLAAREVTVSCATKQPTSVSADVATQCAAADGTIAVVLGHAAGAEVLSWTVQIGSALESGTLGPEVPSATVTADALADGPYAVSVLDSATGEVLTSETATVACDAAPEPAAGIAATILSNCVSESGRIAVTVSLPGADGQAGFTVQIGPVAETDTLTADEPTATVVASGLADRAYDVVVTNGAGAVVAEESAVVACDPDTAESLAAQIIDECVDERGRVLASISYVSGDDPVSWSVSSNGTRVQSGTLSPADPSALVPIGDLSDDQSYSIVVTDTTSTTTPAVVLASEDITFNCGPQAMPGVVSTVVTSTCVAGGSELNVSLSYVQGTEPVDWKVAISNGFTRVGTLSTSQPSRVISTPPLSDGVYTVTITNEVTDAVISTVDENIACALAIPAELSATAAAKCVDGVGEIAIRVEHLSGTEAGGYQVSVSGSEPMRGSLAAGESVTKVVTDLGESAYTVAVSDTSTGEVVSNEIVNVSCRARQGASYTGDVTAVCVDSRGQITFTVNYVAGDGGVVFTFILGGEAVDTIALSGPGSHSFTTPDLADGSYDAAILANATVVASQTSPIACSGAAVSVAMSTNGQPADAEPGVQVETGAAVMWTYAVTNDGTVDLSGVTVTDSELGAVTCPQSILAAGASMTCTANGNAVEGQYSATATVEAQVAGASPVTATDISYYFASSTLLTIEKHTNGFDADEAPGPTLLVGKPVNWSFRVTNVGEVGFSQVTVTDDMVAEISCPSISLAPGQEMVCTATGTVVAGPHANTATVVGIPDVGSNVVATDMSHYLGEAVSVALEKRVNGLPADTVDGQPVIAAGANVDLTWSVANTGNTALTNVGVTDSVEGPVVCPKTALDAGEAMICTGNTTSVAGQQSSTASVTATGPNGVTVTDEDLANYLGSGAGIQIESFTNGQVTGATIAVGSAVEWTYTVTNSGDVDLVAVAVTDSREGAVTCPATTLDAGATMTCALNGTATAGSYTNNATVTATGGGASVTDTATSDYEGVVGAIGDRVFTDLNKNCAFDPGEPGVQGVVVELWVDADSDGAPDAAAPIASTTTGSTGDYAFAGVADGTNYVVKFVAAGSPFTCQGQNNTGSRPDPATGLTGTFTLATGGTELGIDAGLLPATIGDKVFEDSNADGVQDSGEPGVDNIVVKLWIDDDGDGSPDTEIVSTTTDTDGAYSFTAVDPALDHIVQFVGGGRVFTTQSAGTNTSVDSDANAQGLTGVVPVDHGQDVSDVDAGLLMGAAGSIGDRVFLDADEDCVADAGEGIDDLTLTLENAAGTQLATVDSDSAGRYLFDGLAAGDYKIEVDDVNTTLLLVCTVETQGLPGDPAADASVSKTLTAGEDELDIDFGFVECASIGDLVWADADADGIRDSGEDGVKDVKLKARVLTSSGGLGATVATATSDANGAYSFDCLDPRERYKIQVEGVGLTLADVGNNENVDSDISPTTGFSAIIDLDQGEDEVRVDVGVAPPDPEVDIEKLTNNVQSDLQSSGEDITVGDEVKWTYRVKNTGGIVLTDLKVTDDQEGDICTIPELDPGDTKDCNKTGKATPGDYANVGKVVATPKGGGMQVSDTDKSHYTGIVSGSTATPTATTTATATGSPTATTTANNNDLAVTGANSGDMALVALGAIALGLGMVVLGRRRTDGLA